MPVIYFDNFRGFDNTFLPLKNINFFVGENSTGKTSVLKLIKNISDPRFWLTGGFNSDEAELGYFSEIASYSNPKKKYFEIGILGDHRDKQDGLSAIKVRFEDKDGLPSIAEVCLIENKQNIQAVSENGHINLRFDKINLDLINEANKLKYFKKWVTNNGLKNKAFNKVKIPPPFSSQPLFFQLQSVIASEITNKNNKFSGIRIPTFLHDLAWLAPIRTEPKRTYDSYKISFNSDGTHAPYLLKQLLSKDAPPKEKDKVEKILQKFGQDSGMFDTVSINPLGKTKTETAPFELHVKLGEKPLQITNVGYGVSQVLPIIIEVIARRNHSWFAIQQPEIHLHPKAQAAFGDFLYKSFVIEDKCFIVETHSDYTIDRFRIRLNKHSKSGAKKNIESQIVFFKKSSEGNELVNFAINKDGTLPPDQPEEYRNFFINEQLELIQV